jgi:hypothetical protein
VSTAKRLPLPVAPSRANMIAAARPIPLAPPVTSATLPDMLVMLSAPALFDTKSSRNASGSHHPTAVGTCHDSKGNPCSTRGACSYTADWTTDAIGQPLCKAYWSTNSNISSWVALPLFIAP